MFLAATPRAVMDTVATNLRYSFGDSLASRRARNVTDLTEKAGKFHQGANRSPGTVRLIRT